MSALVTGVTAPTPRPSSGAKRTKAVRLFAPEDQRKRGSAKQEADDDDGIARSDRTPVR